MVGNKGQLALPGSLAHATLASSLLLASIASADIQVLFEDFVAYESSGEVPTGICAGDLDGDSYIDIAISNRVTHDVSIYRNDGSGAFQWMATVPVGLTPRYVEAADFDGDGTVDFTRTNTYDAGGELVSYRDVHGDLDYTIVVATYDSAGNQLTFHEDDDENGEVEYQWVKTYDANGNVMSFDEDADGDGNYEESWLMTCLSN